MHALNFLAQAAPAGGGLLQLLFLPLIFVAMYFLLIRPQRKRMKEQAAMQSNLSVGDEVVTTSGIFGFITGIEDDRLWLEIDDDVQIRISRAAIQGKVASTDTTSEDTSES